MHADPSRSAASRDSAHPLRGRLAPVGRSDTGCTFSPWGCLGMMLAVDSWIHRFDQGMFESVARDVARVFEWEYGYAGSIARENRPWFYALGDSQWRGQDAQERHGAERWRRHIAATEADGQSPFRGRFRDLYRLNFISDVHLARKVDQIPLKQWILSRPDRGSLRQLSSSRWVWAVPTGRVAVLRDALREAGLLIVGE